MPRRRDLVIIILIPIGLALYSLAYQFLTPEEEGRLKVQIDSQVFYDDEFNETYDYSQFFRHGVGVYFHEKLNSSEYASGDVEETVELVFANLEEVCQYLKELGVPNVVVGATRFMGNGTFEEVYEEIYNRTPDSSTLGYERIFGGDYPYRNGVIYKLERLREWIPSWSAKPAGLLITKYYKLQERSYQIWSLGVGEDYQLDNPPFLSTFTRYPD